MVDLSGRSVPLGESPRYFLTEREDEEFSRIEAQHAIWRDDTLEVFRKAGFGPGQTLLDLGCGPGHTSLDLSRIVGSGGLVISLDNSARFIGMLRQRAASEAATNIDARLADIQRFRIGFGRADAAFVRWALMFVARPESVIERVADCLIPGGTFAAMEYFRFRSTGLWPRSGPFAKTYGAVYEHIRRCGGDPDIGDKLPEMLIRHGFEIVDLHPILRAGRPGDSLWRWLESTHPRHERLVEEGLLTSAELETFVRDWNEHARLPGAFFTAPPVMVTIARKR